jgi:hypothetical protein
VIVSDRALRVVRGDYSPILARVVESLTAAIGFGACPVNGACPLLTHTQTSSHEPHRNRSSEGLGSGKGWYAQACVCVHLGHGEKWLASSLAAVRDGVKYVM